MGIDERIPVLVERPPTEPDPPEKPDDDEPDEK
jgi:hypothetical protein